MFYTRIIRLRDTDAAGVTYFSRILDICHEAYEHALQGMGIDLRLFFRHPETAIPLVHASVDFLKPTFCGDQLEVHLIGELLTEDEFEVHYDLFTGTKTGRLVSKALTRHVCINPISRQRKPVPDEIQTWLRRTQP